MAVIVKPNQVVFANESGSKEVSCSSPFSVCPSGAVDIAVWDGAAFVNPVSVTEPSLVASAGKYQLTAAGAINLTASPMGRR